MIIRRVAKAVATTAALGAISAVTVLALSGTAGANLVTNQQINVAIPQAPDTPGTPFSSGQTITVSVPPNTLLPQLTGMHIVECEAGPGGAPPTGTPVCDPLTQYFANPTVVADGSLSFSDYQIYALPSPALGETSSNATVCGGAGDPCILYIGPDQTDTSKPHVWSQAFQIQFQNSDPLETGANPGDGTPEVPLAVGLPLAAAGIVGGTVLFRRRKASRTAA